MPPPLKSNRSAQDAFTLIELLCVVAIITILAAVTVPVLTHAKTASKVSVCQSNLRQIACGLQAYIADWNDTYPCTGDRYAPYLWMGRRWRWPLKKYLAPGVFRDPNDNDNPDISVGPRRTILLCPADYEAPSKWDGTSYAYSAAFYHTPDQINSMTTDQLWKKEAPPPECVAQKASAVLYPSRKAMLGEWMSNHDIERTSWWDDLRRGARNYAFADGHVSRVPASCIGPTVSGLPDINLTRDGIRGRDIP